MIKEDDDTDKRHHHIPRKENSRKEKKHRNAPHANKGQDERRNSFKIGTIEKEDSKFLEKGNLDEQIQNVLFAKENSMQINVQRKQKLKQGYIFQNQNYINSFQKMI